MNVGNVFDFLATALHVPVEQVYAVTMLILCGGLIWAWLDRTRTNNKLRVGKETTSEKVTLGNVESQRLQIEAENEFKTQLLQLFSSQQKTQDRLVTNYEAYTMQLSSLASTLNARLPLSEQGIKSLSQQVDSNSDQILHTIAKTTDALGTRVGSIPPEVWTHEVPLSFVEQFQSLGTDIRAVKVKLTNIDEWSELVDTNMGEMVTKMSALFDAQQRSETKLMDVYHKQQELIKQIEAERDAVKQALAEEQKKTARLEQENTSLTQDKAALAALVEQLSSGSPTRATWPNRVTGEVPKAGDGSK